VLFGQGLSSDAHVLTRQAQELGRMGVVAAAAAQRALHAVERVLEPADCLRRLDVTALQRVHGVSGRRR
jgi:hypothetical protein